MATITPGTLVYYAIGTSKFGPISQQELNVLYSQNTIKLDTKVWWKGLESWIEYRWLYNNTHESPTGGLDVTPQLKPAVSNAIVWLIAFSPILAAFAAYFVTGVLEGILGTVLSESLPTALIVGFNVMLCYIDEKSIVKAGYNTENALGSAWLIPVYLFKRAKFLAENNAYAIVWCIVFGLSILLEIY